jgi:hypothetical protein
MDKETQELLGFFEAYHHRMAIKAMAKLSKMQKEDDEEISEEKLKQLTQLDEKIAKNLKFVKTKPPICKGCWFYENYRLDDPKRYILVVETKVDLLPFLFLKPDSKYVIFSDWFFEDYRRQVLVVCPTIECGRAKNPEQFDIDNLLVRE